MTFTVPDIQITDESGACGMVGFATSLKPALNIYTDKAVCGSGGFFAWDQLGTGGTCSVVIACQSAAEACEFYGLGAEWVQQQAVDYPNAEVLSGQGLYYSLDAAEMACVLLSRTSFTMNKCEAVIFKNNPYGQSQFTLVRNLGQAVAQPNANTYIFHEIGQCSPKVDFAALVSQAGKPLSGGKDILVRA